MKGGEKECRRAVTTVGEIPRSVLVHCTIKKNKNFVL